ncbi:MAG: DUF4367 domain-containing protein [Clostridia bacterium]|nr:DUF4367 domain-containing protein [Clostridia bacterium]MBP3555833.1 DUF4367 domain-containing protein [Clostridia bacterium]
MKWNTNKKGLDVLKEAFREINRWEYENLRLDSMEEEWEPSPVYQKRMERLIKHQGRSYWRCVNTMSKRIAVIVLALALTFVLSMNVSAIREPIVNWFIKIYEEGIYFFHDRDAVAKAPKQVKTVYKPGYIPEGFEPEQPRIGRITAYFIFTNEAGEEIVFLQSILDTLHHFDNNDTNYRVRDINGMTVASVEAHGSKSFYWTTDEYSFSLTVFSAEISDECIIKIIESIAEYET